MGSDAEADVGAVVEGVVAGEEGFRGLEGSDIEWVVAALLLEALLGFGECGQEEGIAIGGKYDFPGLEVEGDDAHALLRYRKSVDDGIGFVLLLHGFEHVWNDGVAGGVVMEEMFSGQTAAADDVGTLLGKFLFVGLGIVIVLSTDETVAVANHPYFAVKTAIYYGRSGEALLRMEGKSLDIATTVVTCDGRSDAIAELVTGESALGMAYIAADKLHAVASVGAEEAEAAVGLRCGAVDDGNIVACDDDAILAFLCRTLGDNALFDDFHAAKVRKRYDSTIKNNHLLYSPFENLVLCAFICSFAVEYEERTVSTVAHRGVCGDVSGDEHRGRGLL